MGAASYTKVVYGNTISFVCNIFWPLFTFFWFRSSLTLFICYLEELVKQQTYIGIEYFKCVFSRCVQLVFIMIVLIAKLPVSVLEYCSLLYWAFGAVYPFQLVVTIEDQEVSYQTLVIKYQKCSTSYSFDDVSLR